jgi:hypothetical protein
MVLTPMNVPPKSTAPIIAGATPTTKAGKAIPMV